MFSRYSLAALALGALLACGSPPADSAPTAETRPPAYLSGHPDSHAEAADQHASLSQEDLATLRAATEPFHSIERAEAAGYAIFGGCFQDPTLGGMGTHWANQRLIADSTIDALHPELMVYQPVPSGERRLVAVEYLVFVDEWHAKGNQNPPQLFGQEFHINPTLLEKPFYLLHAWVWRPNPSGIFQDWNPMVHCS